MPSTKVPVRQLVERLIAVSIDGTITYGELSAAVNFDVQRHENRQWLIQARQEILREYGIVFETLRAIGLKRLGGGDGVMYSGQHGLDKTRRTARNGQRTQQRAFQRANDLTPEQVGQYGREQNAFGLIRELASRRVIRALPVDPKPDPLAGIRELLTRVATTRPKE
jgi:hypothetical protein